MDNAGFTKTGFSFVLLSDINLIFLGMSDFAFIQNPIYVIAFLCLNVFLSEWLCKHTRLKVLSSSLLVIVLTAIVANIGLLPSASNASPVYDNIFQYIAPLSIFYLLLGVKLTEIRKAGLPMSMSFLIGALGTVLGTVLAVMLFDTPYLFGEKFYAVAGMMTGTYTGGSVNFNAVALNYGVVKDGAVYSGIVVADNILTALWMIVTIAIPAVMQKVLPISKGSSLDAPVEIDEDDKETIAPMSLSLLFVIGLVVVIVSDYFSSLTSIPSILILTTIALILAQFKVINQISGSKLLGLFCVYIFLAVVGAFCEIEALMSVGDKAIPIFGFTVTIILTHGLFLFAVGRFFKLDWQILAIGSQANIGGASTALALARSFNRNDLLLPSILMGTVGAALGTYLGFLVAEILK